MAKISMEQGIQHTLEERQQLMLEEQQLRTEAIRVHKNAQCRLELSNRYGWKHEGYINLERGMVKNVMHVYQGYGQTSEEYAEALLDIINYATMLYLRAEEADYEQDEGTDAQAKATPDSPS